jgi:hypothetical protein
MIISVCTVSRSPHDLFAQLWRPRSEELEMRYLHGDEERYYSIWTDRGPDEAS